MTQTEYIVSIDLGTTNCAVAYAHYSELKRKEKPKINFFHIPQLIEGKEVSTEELLPSFVYIPGKYEVGEGSYSLPWEENAEFIVGKYAKKLGRLIPGRLVSSAKSWLCHGGVDRTEKILPWHGAEEVEKISPLEASAKYLDHIRKSWNYEIAGGKGKKLLENQDIVLTVPASFNDVARQLTVKAAYMADLKNITLIEEPQAAFYSWLTSYEGSLKRYLGKNRLILVCDVGGGTTDFTLIRVEKEAGEPALRRIAVGEHILLGGDNMDITLAAYIEKKLKKSNKGKLNTRQWGTLCQECQRAKENLLSEETLENFTITLPGTGSKLIGGMLQSEISREEITRIILEGFFPKEDLKSTDIKAPSYGIQEWGLPYAKNPSITHHMAAFLKAHAIDKGPDVILFNGGTLKPSLITDRLVEILNLWFENKKGIKVLPNKNMDLAVARGGVYYGLTRKGRGIKITGGIPRSYYIGIVTEEEKEKKEPQAICLIPRELEEGQEIIISDRKFSLLVEQPITLPLYSSTTRTADMAGKVTSVNKKEFSTLPSLYSVLKTKEDLKEIEVYLKAKATEVGTLELSCITPDKKESWNLEFNLRTKKQKNDADEKIIKNKKLQEIKELICNTFKRKPGKIGPEDVRPRHLLYEIEKKLKVKKHDWNTGIIREFWSSLNDAKKRRRSNPEYEAYWLNATGFTLRPGFGYPLDEWRVKEIWQIFPKWLQFNKEKQSRLEWWIMWRRIAAGLEKDWQEEIFDKIDPYLFSGKKHIKPFPGPLPSNKERFEILRLAVSLEEVALEKKLKLAELIVSRFGKEASINNTFWLLARVGARVPFRGSVHNTIPGSTVTPWIKEILNMEWKDKNSIAFGLSSIARFTGDRKRDVSPEIRELVIRRMKKEKCQEIHIEPVESIIDIKNEEQAVLFGESLPIGLRLK